MLRMERLTLPLHREVERRISALCEDHLTREETLLADLLLSLRQVRDAFFQRNLNVLPTLQIRQQQLAQEAIEMTAARGRLCAALADLLGISEQEVTLRTAALSLPPPVCEQLLQRRTQLAMMVREADQLCQHNAALLGYARGFFTCLFTGRTGTGAGEYYGRQGERHDGAYGPLLETRI
jgi:hypothetical protein